MNLLFDTHFLIDIANGTLKPGQKALIEATSGASERSASVASFWEIAIKVEIGKLSLDTPLGKMPEMLEAYGFSILEITRYQVMERLQEAPATRDPFDRLLLAQCQIEGMRLVTTDRALMGHPLVWRAP